LLFSGITSNNNHVNSNVSFILIFLRAIKSMLARTNRLVAIHGDSFILRLTFLNSDQDLL
ncbi:MAG: hypothetical protein WAM42_25790, partial [Candidatus Nitrosopolaris sp.]